MWIIFRVVFDNYLYSLKKDCSDFTPGLEFDTPCSKECKPLISFVMFGLQRSVNAVRVCSLKRRLLLKKEPTGPGAPSPPGWIEPQTSTRKPSTLNPKTLNPKPQNPKSVTLRWEVSSHSLGSLGKLWEASGKFGKVWGSFGKFGGVLGSFGQFWGIWGSLESDLCPIPQRTPRANDFQLLPTDCTVANEPYKQNSHRQ